MASMRGAVAGHKSVEGAAFNLEIWSRAFEVGGSITLNQAGGVWIARPFSYRESGASRTPACFCGVALDLTSARCRFLGRWSGCEPQEKDTGAPARFLGPLAMGGGVLHPAVSSHGLTSRGPLMAGFSSASAAVNKQQPRPSSRWANVSDHNGRCTKKNHHGRKSYSGIIFPRRCALVV